MIGRLTHERKIDILSLVSSPEQYDSRLNLRTNISMYLLSTLVYLIAEQDILREQDGNLLEKVKRAGPNKGAGWNILK